MSLLEAEHPEISRTNFLIGKTVLNQTFTPNFE